MPLVYGELHRPAGANLVRRLRQRAPAVLLPFTLGPCSVLIAPATESAAPNSDQLEEVIVTASKRPERAQDVPASLSTFTADQLQSLHVAALQDLAAYAPGLTIVSGGSPGQTEIILRGFEAFLNGPMVATLVDDSPVGASTDQAQESVYQLDLIPFDVERIELLRGPQGTVYGANAMAGVLKYVMKYPSLTQTRAQVGGGVFGIYNGGGAGYEGHAFLSAPLINETLALRVSAYARTTPGYIDNPTLGARHENELVQKGARLALLWEPQDNLALRLQGIYQKTDSDGNASAYAERLGSATDPYYRPGAWIGGDLTYNHAIPEPFVGELKLLTATVNWHLALADFTSATSAQDKQEHNTFDVSRFFGQLLPMFDPGVTSTNVRGRIQLRTKRFTQELRVASPSGRHVEWQVGAFYSHERSTNDQFLDALDSRLAPIPGLTPFGVLYKPGTYRETAVFGTLTYHLSDRFDLTGGVRGLTNKQLIQQITPSPQIYLPPSYQTFPIASETLANYAFSSRYHMSKDSMIYLRVANGYRPGNANFIDPQYPQIPPVTKSDTMVDYELGAKAEFLGERASLDFAVFKQNLSNFQTRATTPDGAIIYTINAGNVTGKGFEVAALYTPTSAWHLGVNVAYTDMYATETVPSAAIAAGARMPSSPEWTASATADYRFGRLGRWTADLSASWRYTDMMYTTISSQPPVGVIPGYSLFDFNTKLATDRYEISVYAKNLLDKRAYNSAAVQTNAVTGANFFFGTLLQPRLVGLTFNVNIR